MKGTKHRAVAVRYEVDGWEINLDHNDDRGERWSVGRWNHAAGSWLHIDGEGRPTKGRTVDHHPSVDAAFAALDKYIAGKE